ncbi:MAG: nucleotidyltransferase domain-containing protein [Spirochaetia bacterium]|nr:nucleotidyltransferase domain-containing protein [Spirochaetia bacterium]MCF7953500.1 nucleotidyltransferase domain-containing protein [Spirochaetales bacterium]
MNEVEINTYLQEIIKKWRTLDIKEIILFGSINNGNFNEESDIDLLVILDIDKIPKTYEEKMEMKLELRKAIREVNRKIAIDLLVYTKKEFEILKIEGNNFFKDIIKNGRKLYEKAS